MSIDRRKFIGLVASVPALAVIDMKVAFAVDSKPHKFEKVAGYVLPENPDIRRTTKLHRFYRNRTGDHLYSQNPKVPADYNSEGIAARVFSNKYYGTVPLYALYDPNMDNHFYTVNAGERQNVLARGIRDEGIACYIFDNPVLGSVPLYRMLREETGDHFLTTDIEEVRKWDSYANISTNRFPAGDARNFIKGVWKNSSEMVMVNNHPNKKVEIVYQDIYAHECGNTGFSDEKTLELKPKLEYKTRNYHECQVVGKKLLSANY